MVLFNSTFNFTFNFTFNLTFDLTFNFLFKHNLLFHPNHIKLYILVTIPLWFGINLPQYQVLLNFFSVTRRSRSDGSHSLTEYGSVSTDLTDLTLVSDDSY